MVTWNGVRVYEGGHAFLRSVNDNIHWKAHGAFRKLLKCISVGSKWNKDVRFAE